jgi:hypothetical protein
MSASERIQSFGVALVGVDAVQRVHDKPKERTMRSLVIGTAAIVAIAAAGVGLSARSEAAPLGGLKAAATDIAAIEKTQFVFEGRRHCWYPDGWHGPGWYWCGYHHRVGLGWGGPEGWNGWRRAERREFREERREYRRY